MSEEKLTAKQKLFADYYCGEANLNATRAAKMAMYSPKSASEIGYENLRKPQISAYIEKRLDELAMTSREILAGLTFEAKGSIADVLESDGSFDYESMCGRGADKLVKELKIKRTVRTDPATKEIVDETTHEFKMYDSQSAKVHLGKAAGMFVDKSEVKHGGTIVSEHRIIKPKTNDSNEAT